MRELGARLLQLQRGKEGLASARLKPLVNLAPTYRFLLRIGTPTRHRAVLRAISLRAACRPNKGCFGLGLQAGQRFISLRAARQPYELVYRQEQAEQVIASRASASKALATKSP